MSKPFVIFTSKPDRETLRDCGAFPDGFFRPINEIRPSVSAFHLWEYDINYHFRQELIRDGVPQPPNIPLLFGMPQTGNQQHEKIDERFIASVLQSVMVHIVFLDERENQTGYITTFHSFDEIVSWAEHLDTILRARFNEKEKNLQGKDIDNVLVVVARGQQVRVTDPQIDKFNQCIGPNKCFRSCYFMDYNIAIGNQPAYHADFVWHIMLGHLLKRFMISGAQEDAIWGNQEGIKVWRAFEFLAQTDDDTFAQGRKLAREQAIQLLEKGPPRADGPHDVTQPSSPADIATMETPEAHHREIENGRGWKKFPVEKCLTETKDSDERRWVSVFTAFTQRIRTDTKKFFYTDFDETAKEVKRYFEGIHQGPSHVFNTSLPLVNTDGLPFASVTGQDADVETKFKAINDAEAKRTEMITEMDACGGELTKAQDHYIGLPFAVLIAMVVSSFCGFAIWRMLLALGGNFPLIVWLCGACFIGALSMAMGICAWHRWRGVNAVNAYIKKAETIDQQIVKRDKAARVLIAHGRKTEAVRRRQNAVLMAEVLVERLKISFRKEIKPPLKEVERAGKSAVHSGTISQTDKETAEKIAAIQKALREALRTVIMVNLNAKKTKLNEIATTVVNKYFGTDGKIKKYWQEWCRHDSEKAGYFPADMFINELRIFVNTFITAMDNTVEAEAILDNKIGIQEQCREWLRKVDTEDPHAYFSAVFEGDAQLAKDPVFVSDKVPEFKDNKPELTYWDETRDPNKETSITQSLGCFKLLAFAYEEVVVDLTNNNGVLGIITPQTKRKPNAS